MALPDMAQTCVGVQITFDLDELCITFPSGAPVCAQLPETGVPNLLAASKSLLAQANATMAPLTPIFNVIDVGIQVFKCFKLIPDIITNPLKVGELKDCIPDLAKKVGELLKLIPPLSIPLAILGIVDAILAFLNGMVRELNVIILQLESIAAAATRAAELGNAQLQLVVDCAESSVDAQIQSLNDGLGPVNRLIGLANALAGLAGLPEIPTLNDIGSDPQAALDELQSAIDTLQAFRDLIPV